MSGGLDEPQLQEMIPVAAVFFTFQNESRLTRVAANLTLAVL